MLAVVPERVFRCRVQSDVLTVVATHSQVDQVVVIIDDSRGDGTSASMLSGFGVAGFYPVPGLDLLDGFGFAVFEQYECGGIETAARSQREDSKRSPRHSSNDASLVQLVADAAKSVVHAAWQVGNLRRTYFRLGGASTVAALRRIRTFR